MKAFVCKVIVVTNDEAQLDDVKAHLDEAFSSEDAQHVLDYYVVNKHRVEAENRADYPDVKPSTSDEDERRVDEDCDAWYDKAHNVAKDYLERR